MTTMSLKERTRDMIERYGEVCKRVTAAKILGKSTGSIRTMLMDGRLDYACGGEMVDVRSIARYICKPAQEDFEARKRRYRQRHNSNWAV